MSLDYEFIKNIILVLIPTLIGIFSSKFIINSWQMRKEKFTIKKELLQEFDATIPKFRHNLQRFFWLLGNFLESKSNDSKEHIDEEHKKFLDEHKKIFDRISNFKSSLMLFFDEELLIKFNSLISQMDSSMIILGKMYRFENENYAQDKFELTNITNTMQKDYDQFRKLLIKSKLKDPIV